MEDALRVFIARREATLDALRRIIIDHLHLPLSADCIDPDAPLFGTGLALDSVDALELVVAAEERFQVRFPGDALRSSMRSLNTLTDLILRLKESATV